MLSMSTATAQQPTVAAPVVDAEPRRRRGLGATIARDTLYLLLGLPMGILTFTVIVTGWSTAIGSLITFIGIPVAILTLFLTRGLAWVERRRAALVRDEAIEGRYLVTLPLHRDDWREWRPLWLRLKGILLDGQTWWDTLYGVVLLLVGTIGFTLTVVFWSVTLTLISIPAWWWTVPTSSQANVGDWRLDSWQNAGLCFAVGLILLPITLAVVRGCASVSGALASSLLGCRRQDLEQRVEHLTETRAGAVDAAQAELERIERDLHDGAQARLVAVALDLGLAEQRIAAGEDPASAAALVHDARLETQRALAELRDIARGIRPAMLAERGLEPAITSLAARVGGVPTSVTVDVATRLPTAVETAAYFVVAESLTNVSKHSGASTASVRLVRRGNVLEIDVHDDGRGGANPNGTGIDGLRKRVEALDGTLTLTSPPGGPTHLHGELPCAS